MDVIILAGGAGTRLKEVISDIPKPMAPVRNKPFLEYVLDWLSQYSSVERIILAVGYKSEVIIQYFGDSFKNIPLSYSNDPEPLGTGGAVLNALEHCCSDTVLIINGDTYFPVNIDSFKEFHDNEGGMVSIALKKMHDFDRYGTVEVKQSTITKFNEKKYAEEGLINGGIYIIAKDRFENKNYPAKFSFEKDVLEKQVTQNVLKGKVFDEPFIDIGIPEDYAKVASVV